MMKMGAQQKQSVKRGRVVRVSAGRKKEVRAMSLATAREKREFRAEQNGEARASSSSDATPQVQAPQVPLNITSKNLALTESIRMHAEEKVGHAVSKHTNMVSHVDVFLSVKGRGAKGADEHKCEVTVTTRHHGLIRAEERSSETGGSMYESIDLVSDKLARKLRRTKEKVNAKRRRALHKTEMDAATSTVSPGVLEIDVGPAAANAEAEAVARATASALNPDEIGDESVIIRVKEFVMPPMTVADAVEAMENIDHDWYLFRNSETNEMNVLYSREEGGYGLVLPVFDEDDA